MKKISWMFILFSIVMQAQSGSYEQLWEKVSRYEKQNLPRSAGKIVEEIYHKAQTEKNDNQLIKAFLYRSKYQLTTEENAQLNIVRDLLSEIQQSEVPTKNILENILANLYLQYYQSHRHRYYNRTQTYEKINPDDFRTWDLATIFNEIHLHFQSSLQNGLILQKTPLNRYHVLIESNDKTPEIYPTLYDFLAQDALNFYKTGESNLPQPSIQFELDNPDFLGDNAVFLTQTFPSPDSTAQKRTALLLYKDLTRFHLHDNRLSALLNVTLQRMDFVRDNAVFPDKDKHYLQALISLEQKYRENPQSTLITYRIASEYVRLARLHKTGEDDDYSNAYKEAVSHCKQALKSFPDSEGAKLCQNLLSEIEKTEINIKAERYIIPGENSRAFIEYRNTDHLYGRIYKVNTTTKKKLNKIYNRNKKLAFIQKLPEVASFDQKLINPGDFHKHTTEILIPKLQNGEYLIFLSNSPNNNNPVSFAYGFTQATRISLTEETEKGKIRFRIVDRDSGVPLKEAVLHLYNNSGNTYNNNSIDKQLTTDDNGIAIYEPTGYYYNIVIEVSHKGDKGIFQPFYFNKYQNYKERKFDEKRIFLFTDRSIYRPGQIVYFKGIAVHMREGQSEVIPDTKVEIKLFDVNYQEIANLSKKTNEFGSFSGTFVLPEGGLTGNYSIRIEGKNTKFNVFHRFSVEEYKRPKFSVSFDTIKKAYRLGDTIVIKGKAKAYAGSNISEAEVRYRVTRKVNYPRWYFSFRPVFSIGEAREMARGTTRTYRDGSFEIRFPALPDKKISSEGQPVFTYEVQADVTDLNGETRSGQTQVSAAAHSIVLHTDFPAVINPRTRKQKFHLDIKNLNGATVDAGGDIKIFRLQAPGRVLRAPLWENPEYPLMSKEDFIRLFPHDAYGDETSFYKWKKIERIWSKSFKKGEEKSFLIDNIKHWKPGKYLLITEINDPFGEKVIDKVYFDLKDTSPHGFQVPEILSIETEKEQYNPGEKASITLGSAANHTDVSLLILRKNKTVERRFIQLNHEKKTLEIPITKEDYGGLELEVYTVKFNSYVHKTLHINVPYPKTELEIETATFRDKISPGKQEKWSFIIKGPKGEKVSAEILASMYDMSLDQFLPHSWNINPIHYKPFYTHVRVNAGKSFGIAPYQLFPVQVPNKYSLKTAIMNFRWYGLSFGGRQIMPLLAGKVRGGNIMKRKINVEYDSEAPEPVAMEASSQDNLVETGTDGESAGDKTPPTKQTSFEDIPVRKSFEETAFFFPHLRTDNKGYVHLEFTSPQSLTRWKLMLLAHTKQLNTQIKTLETVNKKELMVLPNPPRFLRQGDSIVFQTKIANLSGQNLSGNVFIELQDALTGKDISTKLLSTETPAGQNFTVEANGNTSISWKFFIPDDVQAVQYTVKALAGSFSDGEQNLLPVLTNRILVTETLPMWVGSGQSKTFRLDKLAHPGSSSIKHQSLTLEVTSNPAWYAIQALPYLMEYPHECSEQTFSRLYANTLAEHIVQTTPRIEQVFRLWQSSDALLSNLEKNPELKSVILSETPWVLEAQSETEQKKRIALLFDLHKMKSEAKQAMRKLRHLQMPSGGFPWFKGSPHPNRYITQYIVSGFGHLQKLTGYIPDNTEIIHKAIAYLDNELIKDYKRIQEQAERIKELAVNQAEGEKHKQNFLENYRTGNFQIQYLYARSFYPEIEASRQLKKAMVFFTEHAYKYKYEYNLQAQSMLILIAHREGRKDIADSLLNSLRETAVYNEELGMYWKKNTGGYYWHQAAIETQSLIIEAFSEAGNDPQSIDKMKIWLLKNKQTNRWRTTKATAEAVYALLLQGSKWINDETTFVNISIGDKNIHPLTMENTKVEAGSGYFKTTWLGGEITPDMAEVSLTKKDKGIAWGALYWQYFEDLDKITPAKTPLSLRKDIFKVITTNRGEKLMPVSGKESLQIGDLVRVRIELSSDRDMEFIHMKDMRAAGLEPLDVMSRYRWQDGLGYYQSTRDAATHFFFDYLPKGIYVFEYDLRVNNTGDFSNGITLIESMYAPEFSSHSRGERIKVK